MRIHRYHYIDSEEMDYLRNIRYYQNVSPKENHNNKEFAVEVSAVVDIFNSTRQVIIEPGVIDLLGNTLMHLSGNTSSSMAFQQEDALSMAMMDTTNMSVEECCVVPETDFRHSLLVTVLFCVAYVLVFVIGFLGNLLTVAVVYRLPRMRSVTNYFIVSLAIADILVLMLCLPGTLMSNIFVRE